MREAGHLGKDLCRYTDEEGEHFFIRACIEVPIHPREGGSRPLVILERTDLPLSIDFHEGISVARAQEIAEAALHRK